MHHAVTILLYYIAVFRMKASKINKQLKMCFHSENIEINFQLENSFTYSDWSESEWVTLAQWKGLGLGLVVLQ